jgi:hypothetical protein
MSGFALIVYAAALNAAEWNSECRFRVLLEVDMKRSHRSSSPASIDVDFQDLLSRQKASGTFDPDSVEVIPVGFGDRRVPHRVEPYFGVTKVTLHFVVPNEKCTNFSVYFDTVESKRGKPARYHGIVGDGDKFSEQFGRREISASHFDTFADLDGDGDLDLFKGGVEPFVYCFENVGANRFVERGRLTSDGEVFKLPCSRSNRSWVTVAFYDIDDDGDQDFFPSFGDGPDSGRIIFYRNTTRESDRLTFTRVDALQTASGIPLAGGAQAGGWFPSIAFIKDFDRDGKGPDALVGSDHRCWLYRNAGMAQFADPVALHAGGTEIMLTNPRFDAADIDNDGDLDLFASCQPGPVYWFKNTGTRTGPVFDKATPIAWEGKYLIGDAHSGAMVADFDRDGLLDLAAGRFWERADLNHQERQHDYGGFWKNNGSRTSPRFERQTGPFTEQFQLCDAVRQNSVRAADWDNDGKLDLLAGDTDGFIWFFRNKGDRSFPLFEAGKPLRAGSGVLSVAATGGHARLDVCDWNDDGKKDLVVADGSGTVTLFINRGSKSKPALGDGERLSAGDRPIQVGGRSSVLVCDWNKNGHKDLLLADDKGYYFCKNSGISASPSLAAPVSILFGGKKVSYVRPNLGSFVDWDGDGKKDLIGCHFENSIRFYRNIGSGAVGAEPEFADPEGLTILQGESPQMISGADAVDWNGDGDIDILTGQGHGGSNLRFFGRDWIEDERNNTHPVVSVGAFAKK